MDSKWSGNVQKTLVQQLLQVLQRLLLQLRPPLKVELVQGQVRMVLLEQRRLRERRESNLQDNLAILLHFEMFNHSRVLGNVYSQCSLVLLFQRAD